MTVSADQIDSLLPQTQCERCGYAGCKPYAEAIARGETDINRCAPGGEATINALAELTGLAAKPLDADCAEGFAPNAVAFIDEDVCIGCTRCIQACPVDAITGAAKYMHTIIEDECTGCELCVPACPVDCIDMVPASSHYQPPAAPPPDFAPDIAALRDRHLPDEQQHAANHARHRFDVRNTRLAREQAERKARREQQRAARASKKRRNDIAAMVASVRKRHSS